MKKLVPLSVLAIVLGGLLVVSPASANAQSAGLVSSVLNKMEKNRQSLKSLRAGLSMAKYNAQLRDEEKYEGIVAYLPGSGREASVRIEWRSPQHEILAVSNGKYTLFRPRLKMAYVGNSKDGKVRRNTGNIMNMLYMSRRQLEAEFQPVKDVREETLWGGVSTIHLTLVPKGNASFKYAEIWVDSAGMPVQTKIVEKNDDATTMRLSDLRKNVPISSGEFSLKLESDVKIIKS
ncbi:MAG TPA: outer membrane lipoprotein carrier protein LolA [Pyrinomonadaceae bacterium]|nr:outer membrane lipoprotein carrier protein LolA [Pyrinomonadaceae bacterium]